MYPAALRSLHVSRLRIYQFGRGHRLSFIM
nr:MAG TPA: hypothetical protein [Caudoviricetes sp.]